MIVWALRLPPELGSWATGAGPECGAILGSWLSTPHLMFHFAVCRPFADPIDNELCYWSLCNKSHQVMSRQPYQNSSSRSKSTAFWLAPAKPHGILKSDASLQPWGKEKDKMPEVDQWGSLAAPKMAKHGTHPQHKLENQLVAPRGQPP